MSSFQEIMEAIDQQARAFDAFKKTNDERLEAKANGDEAKAKELDAKLAKIDKDVTQFNEVKRQLEVEQQLNRERLEELESRAKSPGKTIVEKTKDEYKSTFINWMRNRGQSPVDEQKMLDLQHKLVHEYKDVTIGSTTAGGYAVPEEIAREIERLELLFSPVRSLIKVVQVGTSDYKELVDLTGATAGWVGETGSRSATATPTLREVTPTQGELYAYPQVSEWSLDDIFFNVETWLTNAVAEQFAILEATAVVNGNGTTKPTGLLNATPVTTDDFASPLRAAAALEYIPVTASPVAIAADDLISLVYKLRTQYRSRATWVMNSATTGIIRKLKDSQNQYLWAPGLQAGQPDRLLGYPVSTWEQWQDATTDLHPIAFGDFRRGYVLVDRVGMRMTRDNVTTIGHVKFYIRRREGGIVLNNDAIKLIKFAAS